MKFFICIVMLFYSFNVNGQKYFEGEIIYKLHAEKKDSAFDLSNIISYPAKTFTFLFKNGIWINAPDSGMIDFGYFRHDENRQYYKFVGVDTLVYYNYDRLDPDQDSLLSIETQFNTDTILGYYCHRLILKTNKMTLTLAYSPSLKIDPKWFSLTKGGYYDIIYSHTKSLYLMSIIETSQFISRDIAVKVTEQKLEDEIFENINRLPKRPIPLD